MIVRTETQMYSPENGKAIDNVLFLCHYNEKK